MPAPPRPAPAGVQQPTFRSTRPARPFLPASEPTAWEFKALLSLSPAHRGGGGGGAV